jgi:hypothetical protein
MLNRLTRLVASHPDKVAHYAVSNLLALVGMGVGLAFRSVPLALWLAAGGRRSPLPIWWTIWKHWSSPS